MGQSVNLFWKIVGCILIYFCGRHKNNFLLQFHDLPSVGTKCYKVDFPNSCIERPLEKHSKNHSSSLKFCHVISLNFQTLEKAAEISLMKSVAREKFKIRNQ